MTPATIAVVGLLAVALAIMTQGAPPPRPPPTSGTVELRQVDGGPNYYGRFSNARARHRRPRRGAPRRRALPDTPSFWPIATWGSYNHNPTTIQRDWDAGLNTYIWVADPAGGMDDIRADGRFKVIQGQWEDRSLVGSATAGWAVEDELDMSYRCTVGCFKQLERIIRDLNCVKRCANGRLLYTNYGKGVTLLDPDEKAAQWINGRSKFGRYQDVISTGVYWFTDPYEGPATRFGSKYGDDVAKVRRLDALDGRRQPVWSFVETGWPWSPKPPARKILPDELRSAAWHALIAGARGIIWFQQSFDGPCADDHHTIRSNCEGTRPEVTAVNGQIRDLAPVLNAPFVTSGHSATDTMDGNVAYMVKWSGGKFYVFAGADRGGGSATFSMRCVGDATALRLAPSNRPGEAASIPLNDGKWTDSFADKNSVHIYRIDGGSTCGLA
jgi:hypothetical protein